MPDAFAGVAVIAACGVGKRFVGLRMSTEETKKASPILTMPWGWKVGNCSVTAAFCCHCVARVSFGIVSLRAGSAARVGVAARRAAPSSSVARRVFIRILPGCDDALPAFFFRVMTAYAIAVAPAGRSGSFSSRIGLPCGVASAARAQEAASASTPAWEASPFAISRCSSASHQRS